jgi:Na+/H+ antiporter NhaD/arsenite permease-like protein
MVVTFQVLIRLFKIRQPLSDLKKANLLQKVGTFNEWSVVKDKKTFYRSIVVMIVTLVLLASADFLGIGLGFIAIVGGAMMLVVSHVDPEKILHGVDWSVIFFVASLLILVGGLSEAGVLQTFSEPLIQLASTNFLVVTISILWVIGLLSSVIVDIPLTAAFIPIVQVITNSLGTNSVLLWWAIIFGVSLGANFTPIGSSSTIIALGVLKKQQKVSFKEFSKTGIVVCTIQLTIGSLYLIALYFLFLT